MRFFFKLIFIFTALQSAYASQSTLSHHLNNLLKNQQDQINIGLIVLNSKSNHILFQKNPKRYFTPASNEKLFTAFAALNLLSPQYVYRTNLYFDPKTIKDGILRGGLYFKFSGDPSLTIDQLETLISHLSVNQIRSIAGPIYIDDSIFDQVSKSKGTTWDDQFYCWGAPVSALIVNHNCVKSILLPNKEIGGITQLELPAYPQSMTFINRALTGDASDPHCRLKIKSATLPHTIDIDGCTKKGGDIEMAVDDPKVNMQKFISYLLAKSNIHFESNFIFGKFDNLPDLIATNSSLPLGELIKTMLKDSDNLYADAIFKTLGAIDSKMQGNFDNASEALHRLILTHAGIALSDKTFIDGAGGSRYNYIQPAQISALLTAIQRSPYAAIFKRALATANVDGTLKDRLPKLKGQVFAKTGTETGVSALSGYMITKHHHHIVFSIMINNFIESPKLYKQLEDKICESIWTEA